MILKIIKGLEKLKVKIVLRVQSSHFFHDFPEISSRFISAAVNPLSMEFPES